MKTYFFRLLTGALCTGLALSAGAETTLSLSEVSIVPGSVGTVTVTLNNDMPCRGLSSHIELPEGLTLTGIETTDATTGCMANVNTIAGSEQFYILPSGKILNREAGSVCELTIAASNSFKGGSIVLADPVMVDEAYSDRKIEDYRGYVSGMGDFAVSVSDLMILPGETKDIEICMTNQGYVGGMQADLYLPAGLTLDTKSVSTTARTAGMTTMAAYNNESYYRLMVFSPVGSSISGTDGVVLTAKVTADADIDSPLAIQVRNVSVADLQGRNYRGTDSSASVTVTEEQSDIVINFPEMGIEDGNLWLKVGDSRQVKIAASNYDGAYVWKSSNEAVVKVSATGEVNATGAGNAVITVSAADGREISATLPVIAYLAGDSNADKWVDVADVVNVNNYIVGNDVETFVFVAADVNEDKDIDVTDAVKTAYIALEADFTPAKLMRCAKASVYASTADYLDVTVSRDRIVLGLPNCEYSALQADINVGEGMTVESVQLGAGASSGHRVITRMMDNNTMRVMVFAMNNSEFEGRDILQFQLSGSPASASNVEVSNVIAADSDAHSFVLDAKVSNDITTGIIGVTSEEVIITPAVVGVEIRGASDETARVYTLDGKLIVSAVLSSDCEYISLEKGTYMVTVKNSVKKILVK